MTSGKSSQAAGHRPMDLRDALDEALAGRRETDLAARVGRLVERYRAGGAASVPILSDELDVLAYAAYRMPATYAACVRVLSSGRAALPEIASMIDLGGGTGAACWAAADVWPGVSARLLEQVPVAGAVAQQLDPSLDVMRWRLGKQVPAADLVSVSYVLSELSVAQQAAIVDAALGAATSAVLIVEPGTPDGYRRIVAARSQVIAAGWEIVAPCPHQFACPLVAAGSAGDWCHFAVRVERSSLHRRVKGAELGYEDEKFSYLLASRGSSNAPRGSSNASPGSANASPGSANASPGSANASPGSANASRGSANASRGSANASRGSANAPRESANASPGSANASPGSANASPGSANVGRILRHPVKRKGLVELSVCRPDGSAGREVVTKRNGPSYKQARDVRWGDPWPLA